MIPSSDDTIAAIATAPGAAGLAVLRVSGPDALRVADQVFRGAGPLAVSASHTLHHGWAVWPAANGDPSRRLDEVVAAVFRAPRSYTREDVVELSCHGGGQSGRRILAALLAAGARLATPGEFTLRAFLNGRVDLAQAEAVADLIRAETDRAHQVALAQLAGELSRRIGDLCDRVTDAVAEIEARVDFAEDVGGIEIPDHVIAAIRAVTADLAELLAGAPYARAVREGVRVPLVGRPNVGKSSLFNALLGERRAIVSDVPGTTRDRVSEAIELCGVRVTLSDTAGLRDTKDAVESLGVASARETLAGAALAIWVVDSASPLEDEDRRLAERFASRPVLVAMNKCDRPARTGQAEVEGLLRAAVSGLDQRPMESSPGSDHMHETACKRSCISARIVPVSATAGLGLDTLRDVLGELLGAGGAGDAAGAAGAIGNARHVEALERAHAALERAARAGTEGSPGEIVALELREALGALGEVTGRTVGADVLERIFSRFCVGK